MSITIPNVFAPGGPERSADLNANFGVIRDDVNAHEAANNPHQTKLSDVLALNNSAGAYSINFNGNQALTFVIENLATDPTPSRRGRLFLNSTDGNLKFDTGSTIVTVAGAGVNNLSSVLNAGNSAGAQNLDLNQNQLLHMRIENVTSDPTPGNVGRLIYNTTAAALKLDTGSSLVAVGGSQGLASVLGVSNSTGASDIDFNGNHAKNMIWEALAADPGTATAGRVYFNTTTNKPRFYNGSAWVDVGNTNTLAQVLALGSSVGASSIDFNNKQALHLVLWNNAGSPGTGTAGLVWYDTGTSQINYETGTSNHALCSLDQTQTLTNKTISGATNTLSNIPDAALSSNVALLNANQTVSGTKTFSASPVLTSVKTPSGGTHSITDGLGNDTVTLNNAVQELKGKTLNAPTLSGNLDFANYQAVRARAENVATPPAAGQPGRIVFKTSTGELLWDNGTNWTVVGSATSLFPSLAQVLGTGNSAGTNDIDFNEHQALNMRLENLASDPVAGNAGRAYYNTAAGVPRYDTGAAIKEVVNLDAAQTLSNKTISGATNSLSNIPNAATTAASANTPSAIVARDASGNFSAGTITANLTGNASGTSANVTGVVAETHGGTNQSSYATGDTVYASAANTLSKLPGPTSATKQFLSSTGTGAAAQAPAWGTIAAGDVPNLDAAKITSGTFAEARGGTNQSTYATGDTLYSSASNTLSKLAGNTTTTKKYLSQTGTGAASAAPTWSQPAFSELTGTATLAQIAQVANNTILGNNSGSAASPSALTTAQVNTLLGTLSNPMTTGGDIIYGGASGTPTRLGNGTAGQYLASAGGTAAPAWTTIKAPTIQKFTSGSGTYTTPAGALYLKVRMVGGGGGGGSSGTASGGTGGTGGNTTFGTTLLVANGGVGGTWGGSSPSGGTASLGTGPVGVALSGAMGSPTPAYVTSGTTTIIGGGLGGASPLGGAGVGATPGQNNGNAAIANTGSGGGGAGVAGVANAYPGVGGAAGGFVDAIITSPAATYAYAVGAGGAGGTLGTSGAAGGAGAAGIIIVEEHYQ